MKCNICDKEARLNWKGVGHETWCCCGLTYHRIKDPDTGEWIIGVIIFGEEVTKIPPAFEKAFI